MGSFGRRFECLIMSAGTGVEPVPKSEYASIINNADYGAIPYHVRVLSFQPVKFD